MRKLTHPIRKIYWKNKLLNQNMQTKGKLPKGIKYFKERKNNLYIKQEFQNPKTTITINGKKISLKGAEYFKWEYQKQKYIERESAKLNKKRTQIKEALKGKIRRLLPTNHPVYSLTQLFINCVKLGEVSLTGNPHGPDLKMKLNSNKTKISLEYFLKGQKKLNKLIIMEIKPREIQAIQEYIPVFDKLTNISVKEELNQKTLNEIKKIK